MDNAITKMIERAELCIERGQFKMAKSAYDEIDKRLGTDQQDEFTEDRLSEILYAIQGAESEPVEQTKCHKCHGSGRYGDLGKCFACLGKGYQTERDTVREKNYWARRERSAHSRAEIESQYF